FYLSLLKVGKRHTVSVILMRVEFSSLSKYTEDVYRGQYSKTTALSGRTSQFKLILRSIKQ
ncbi:Uncharacterized protein DAT39_001515, partial [Clarias magur]